MTGHVDARTGDGAFEMEEGLPHAPMAMPEQQIERPARRGLRLLLLPVLIRSRVRAR